eukprot:GEMP01060499.1.p1 GENE.GEMP01060499.1~~GEMP01060499.1.p1  ORF type:complete len:238 (+),score=43.93 GEMP01060499.1:86-799(+)
MGDRSSRRAKCEKPPHPPSPRAAPDRAIKNSDGHVVRLNVMYYQRESSLRPLTLIQEDALRCPEELVAAEQMHECSQLESGESKYTPGQEHKRDVKQVWKEFMGPHGALEELEHKYPKCIILDWCILSVSLVPGMSWVLYFLNQLHKRRCRALDAEMVVFQNNMNDKLKNFGIMVKTQSNFVTVEGGDGLTSSLVHWFSFALTPGEVMKLQSDTHQIQGVGSECCTFSSMKHGAWTS